MSFKKWTYAAAFSVCTLNATAQDAHPHHHGAAVKQTPGTIQAATVSALPGYRAAAPDDGKTPDQVWVAANDAMREADIDHGSHGVMERGTAQGDAGTPAAAPAAKIAPSTTSKQEAHHGH